VEVLLRDGYHIIAADIAMPHLEQMKEEVVRQLGISDRRMDLVEFDLRNVDRIGSLVDLIRKCLSETNPLWGYVNNAAVYLPSSKASTRLTEINVDDVWEILKVNLLSAFLVSREMFKILKEKKGGGSIVFISSVAGKKGSLLNPVYGMTKAAVANLAKSIAHEGGSEKIRANAISPGMIETRMGSEVYSSKESRDERIKKNLIQRACTPEEVAHLVKYLLSEFSGSMTGEDLDLSGGTLIK
jgi:NAD(P)-dependent dehydrogenase (short-subunit alcohol dehydrogenase family)